MFGSRRVNSILQAENAECGLACVAMLANYFGHDLTLATLRRDCAVSTRGATLAEMIRVAHQLDLEARAVKLSARQALKLADPFVAHWQLNHFVVVEPGNRRRIGIVDPAVGKRAIEEAEWRENFTGVALMLQPRRSFEPRRERRHLRLWHLLAGMRGLTGALLQILLVSLALQLLVLLMPFYSQLVLDEVIVSGDVALLNVLFLAALLVSGFQVLLTVFRRWAILHLGTRLQLAWNAQLFAHLLKLPLAFFETRHTGDVQSRFRSLGALRDAVSGNVIEALLDGVMATTTCVALYLYSPGLATLVLATVLIYLLLRAAVMPLRDRLLRESIAATARKDSVFLETLRAILPIKNFSAAAWREGRYADVSVHAANRDVRVAQLDIVESGIRQCLLGLQFVFVVWLAAKQILAGNLSVGRLVAFLAFSAQFSSRSAAFVDRIMEFRLLRVHLDRLADIADSEPEPATGLSLPQSSPVLSELRGVGLGFRYGASEPWVFRSLSFSIRRGEHVAITGPSGCGKSTLLKLLAGLLAPVEGSIVVNSCQLQGRGLAAFREQLGIVMQRDALLSGSLFENIAFFDNNASSARVQRCAAIAGLHEEIQAMPMQYNTRVGDMGLALSGGQLQRVLLARALYRNPQVLFLDEASSHLDRALEMRIMDNLRHLNVTVISIAHRAESIRGADRVFSWPA